MFAGRSHEAYAGPYDRYGGCLFIWKGARLLQQGIWLLPRSDLDFGQAQAVYQKDQTREKGTSYLSATAGLFQMVCSGSRLKSTKKWQRSRLKLDVTFLVTPMVLSSILINGLVAHCKAMPRSGNFPYNQGSMY